MNTWYQPGYEDAAGLILLALCCCIAMLVGIGLPELREAIRRRYWARRRAQRGGHYR